MPVPNNPKLSDIQAEFGGTNPIELSEYYSGGPLVPAGAPAPEGPIPSSGQISVGQFRGAENVVFIDASGGSVSTSGDYKIHTFTGPGTFTVNTVGNPAGSTTVDYLVIGGGAAGGGDGGGGGGAGGYRESFPNPVNGGLSVSEQGYPITIGSGAANSPTYGPTPGNQGSPSVFSSITSAGGGGGGAGNRLPDGSRFGNPGGSGGGAGARNSPGAGSGNVPPVSPPQGQPGGNPPADRAGGGGGHGGGSPGAPGGSSTTSSINGSSTARAGGGGGGGGPGGGGAAGGGGGATPGSNSYANAGNATANTGSGAGGGGMGDGSGGGGGSGIVIIRYKYQ